MLHLLLEIIYFWTFCSSLLIAYMLPSLACNIIFHVNGSFLSQLCRWMKNYISYLSSSSSSLQLMGVGSIPFTLLLVAQYLWYHSNIVLLDCLNNPLGCRDHHGFNSHKLVNSCTLSLPTYLFWYKSVSLYNLEDI